MTMENAGHILGSSSVYMQIGEGRNEHKLLFSGDIKYEKSWLFDGYSTLQQGRYPSYRIDLWRSSEYSADQATSDSGPSGFDYGYII